MRKELWQAYRLTGAIPILRRTERARKAPIALRDVDLIPKVYNELRVNALKDMLATSLS